MVAIEYSTDDEDNNGPYGDQYEQPGAGTQAAASALLDFGAASGEKQLTPEQLFKQSQEKKHRYFNALAGNITGMDEEDEDYMYDFNVPWNAGEQQARQEQVTSPMRNTTSETNRRVTISHQKQKNAVINPYKKSFTTNQRNRTPDSLAIRVNGKENATATVVSKKTGTRRRLTLPTRGLAMTSKPVSTKKTVAFPASQSKKSTNPLVDDYARSIHQDKNLHGVFTEGQADKVTNAKKNTKPYEKGNDRLEEQFFKILTEVSKDKDAIMHQLCTNVVEIADTFNRDREFYAVLGFGRETSKRIILNRCFCTYTLNIMNKLTGAPLEFNTQNQYLKQIFNVMSRKGIQFRFKDFYDTGGLLAVVRQDYQEKQKADPTLGTNRTKAEFDELARMKFNAALNNKTLTPFDNDEDMLKCIIIGLGMHLGFRGRSEIAKCRWDYFDFETIPMGPMKGLRKVSARPGGGWDKIHTLGVTNGSIRKGPPPHYIENTADKFDWLVLVEKYRGRCDPEQERFLHHAKRNRTTKIWFKPKLPVGENKVRQYVREVAELCKFKDFEKFAAHDCRHQLGTLLYSNPAVPEKVAMAQMRHTSTKTKATYTHMNTVIDTNLQATIHQGLHGGQSALIPTGPAEQLPDAGLQEEKKMAADVLQEERPVLTVESKPAQEEERPVLDVESKPAQEKERPVHAPLPAALLVPSQSVGMKRNAVSEEDHNHLQRKYKKLKKSNTKNLEEARKERAALSSTNFELQKK